MLPEMISMALEHWGVFFWVNDNLFNVFLDVV